MIELGNILGPKIKKSDIGIHAGAASDVALLNFGNKKSAPIGRMLGKKRDSS